MRSWTDEVRVRKQDIDRRTVIEAYVRYDYMKKKLGISVPDFNSWNWAEADAIDNTMASADLKKGIPAGYLLWDQVEVTISDLRECAVDASFFPDKPRPLGLLESAGFLRCSKPDPIKTWYERILHGETFDETAPMLIRPAVRAESPAYWYVEDGSGRATALIANQHIFDQSKTVAIGYLGRKPDRSSSFMQEHFHELL